jgi:twinkle protein
MLDNMTTLTNHLSPSEQNTEIARIATELAGMADELGIRIFVFSHLNPPGGKLSHEEGAEVKEHQFTGSRALQRWCQLIIGFERNKQAPDGEKHHSRIRVIKDRNYGNTGLVYTKYSVDSGCLEEREGDELEVPSDDDDSPI